MLQKELKGLVKKIKIKKITVTLNTKQKEMKFNRILPVSDFSTPSLYGKNPAI